MKKVLYANGDSFTFGMEIIADHDHSEANKDFAHLDGLLSKNKTEGNQTTKF